MSRQKPIGAEIRCTRALRWCLLFACASTTTALDAATLSEKAKESGCASKPTVVEGSMFRCLTDSGAFSYFNVPGVNGDGAGKGADRRAPVATTPPGFPRVDAATQKGRDDIRRKVLGDELATEEKQLSEARAAYGSGAPAPLPEEQADAEKYRQRIARLRQAIQLHERNIDAIRKELSVVR